MENNHENEKCAIKLTELLYFEIEMNISLSK